MKKIFSAGFAILAAALILIGCGSNAKKMSYTAGTYTATAQGMNGEVTVSVTFDNSSIKKITIDKHQETVGISDAAIKQIPEQIIKMQSLAVDTVSGASVTSKAILSAVSSAVEQAGGDVDTLKMSKMQAKAGKTVQKTADVIVVGGGGAGLSAAIAACQNNAKVILIEKTALLGGNTIRAGGPYNAVDPERQANVQPASEAAMKSLERLLKVSPKNDLHKKYQDQLQKELDAYKAQKPNHLFDCLALHILQTYDGGDYAGKIEFIEKMCSESLNAAEWLESNGLVWRDTIVTVPGGLWPRAHVPQNAAGSDYINTNKKLAEKMGVEIILNCKGESLIKKDGRITGVKAVQSNGTQVILNAKKAVVLASGGFAASKEMRKKYNSLLNENLGTTNNPANTGDGITMAEKVNANLIGMEYIQCLPLGNPETGGLNGWIGGIGVEYYYQVNKSGKRFMAEDGRRDVMTKALLEQPGSFSYVIADSHVTFKDGKNLWGDDVEKLVADKKIFRADTIEDLAKQIGIDPAVLKQTNDAFNKAVEAGKDNEFGRSLFGQKMDKAPFYASPRMPTVHHTMGGIEINLDTQVLDKNGNVIPGLYAAGEVTGGIHGKNRLGGNALVDIHVFGRIAGTNAAKN
ncbi:flavocytochrome c [Treponema lecithinolyticum]|uniref:Urocanate reductase n=1 Tax=Treponema lecithinolyticum ATCC 700332 TaxID=1321815 RepID=A0ABN0NWE8_TRELE|nr:flavocytochrome c [Treponema lecithinolyticum]ERJ91683.1 flavocytochrome c [Treponema lecithinolyticum ATCC 700332]